MMTDAWPLLTAPVMGQPAWMWLGFAVVVVVLLALDLGVLHRTDREIGVRESLLLSGGYIAIGLAFGAGVWATLGADSGLKWLTGYVVEKSLSIDNVFVIAMIFASLAIPRAYQHRVLFWGILGVIVLRGIMIGLGTALVSRFEWLLWLFGLFLLVTGVRMAMARSEPADPRDSRTLQWLRRHLRVTETLHGNAFVVRQPATTGGPAVLWVTPLFLALLMVEAADLLFAVDSVPAVLAISTDPFIVYTSNIFAVLGLRALYFALAAMVHRFAYLKHALAAVLVFIGGKIMVADWLGHVPPAISLGVTFGLIGAGIAVSLWKTRQAARVAALPKVA